MSYQFHPSGTGVIDLVTLETIVPGDTAAWRKYLAWMYAGGVATPPDPPLPGIVMLSKMTVVNRLTNLEAEAIEAARPSQPAKDRLLWEAASMIDPSNSIIVAFLTTVLGEERMLEVLAAETYDVEV